MPYPSLFAQLKEQFFGKPHLSEVESLEGRTVIVTGANAGLGFAAAVHLARLSPAHLILAVRTVSKGEEASKKLLEQTSYAGKLEVWELDLASFESVKKFGKRVNELERCDILLENAGVAAFDWKQTGDGWETMLQVNGLSTGLLALLALPALQRTAKLSNPGSGPAFKPHLTIVCSELHAFATFKEAKVEGPVLDVLNKKELSNLSDRYNITKLINVFLSHQISQLSSAQDIVVNNVNPGLCVSELRRDMPVVIGYLLDKAARSTIEGALNLAWAATADTSLSPGTYISTSEVRDSSDFSLSEEGVALERKIWAEMVEVWKGLGVRQEIEKVL